MTDREVSDLQRFLEKELEIMERRIYDLEKVYLEETSTFGNLIKGWESGLHFKSHKHHMFNAPKKFKIAEKDRIFSLSSCTSPANRALKKELEYAEISSAVTPAQTNSFLRKRKIKKNKFLHPPTTKTGHPYMGKDFEEEEGLSSDTESAEKGAGLKVRTKRSKNIAETGHSATKGWIKNPKNSRIMKVKKTKKSI